MFIGNALLEMLSDQLYFLMSVKGCVNFWPLYSYCKAIRTRLFPMAFNCFANAEAFKRETLSNKTRLGFPRGSMLRLNALKSFSEAKGFTTGMFYQSVIRFFGFYICKNRKALLEEYPYDFGYDEFWPHLASDETYNGLYRDFYNTDDLRKT